MAEEKTTNPKDAAAIDRLPLHLCPATLEIFATLAFVCGAVKYEPHNWREAGVSAAVYYDACRRHLNAWFNGEDDDPDEKVPHLASAAASLAVIIDAMVCGKLNDTRVKSAPVAALQRSMPTKVREIREATAAVVERKRSALPQRPELSQRFGW